MVRPIENSSILLTDARLAAMALSIGGEIGHSFLINLVSALRETMDASLVLITIGEGEPIHRARAIFVLSDGQPAENIAYDLDGTPCKSVYRGETVAIPVDLARRFPDEEGLEGYVGVPVRDSDETVIGHLAVFSASRIENEDAAKNIVRIFGARVESDLRHTRLLEQRERLIHDLRQTNDMLSERSQALHNANKFKTQLLGMIAHDLRNPLAALYARAELLETRLRKADPVHEKALDDVIKIQALSERLSGMIESTLSRCREDSTEIEVRPRRTDLSRVVQMALETNAFDADRKKIDLIGPATEPVWAYVDEGLCLEAIDNLVSNAIKYSPMGLRVIVSIDEGDEGTEIHVKDRGPGFSESDQYRVFQPFRTLSAQPTGGETATGLGLVNVSQIAKAHGGSVSIQNHIGDAGCTVTLRLSPHL